MSSVRFVFPKPRLAQLLKTPGGVPVAEALERAQANLEEIKPTCSAEILALLELAEVGCEALSDTFDDVGLERLYAVAVRGVGGGRVCGAPGVDIVLTSLCDLLDYLRTQKRYDREAVGVHIRAWRLLMTLDLPPESQDAILDGLKQVSRRYAA